MESLQAVYHMICFPSLLVDTCPNFTKACLQSRFSCKLYKSRVNILTFSPHLLYMLNDFSASYFLFVMLLDCIPAQRIVQSISIGSLFLFWCMNYHLKAILELELELPRSQ